VSGRQQVRRADFRRSTRRVWNRLYGQVFSSYPLPVVFQDVLLPVWQELLMTREQFGLTSEWLFLDAFCAGVSCSVCSWPVERVRGWFWQRFPGSAMSSSC
jgi:hypothetical protein